MRHWSHVRSRMQPGGFDLRRRRHDRIPRDSHSRCARRAKDMEILVELLYALPSERCCLGLVLCVDELR